MGKTARGTPGPGTDWWSRRPYSCWVSKGRDGTRWWKRKVHKRERAEANAELRKHRDDEER